MTAGVWVACLRRRWSPMAQINSAYLDAQRERWMRPDAHRFIRPDWRRYVRPEFQGRSPLLRPLRRQIQPGPIARSGGKPRGADGGRVGMVAAEANQLAQRTTRQAADPARTRSIPIRSLRNCCRHSSDRCLCCRSRRSFQGRSSSRRWRNGRPIRKKCRLDGNGKGGPVTTTRR